MNKIIKNSALLKAIMVVAFGSILAIISIIYFAQSYSFYQDEWGTDISFDNDSIVMLLCSIAILIYGIYSVIAYKKSLSSKNVYYGSFGVVACLISFYPLGRFFRALAKGSTFVNCQDYLYISIIGIVMLFYLIFSYLNEKKN